MERILRYVTRRPAGIAAGASLFKIEVRFFGGLSQTQMDAFKTAADRWSSVIIGDLPTVMVDGEPIDDVVILAQGADIDGKNGILGQAGPTHLRPSNAGAAALLPAKGKMIFDTADLTEMENKGTLKDVITHEMGHVLGIGTIWREKGLLQGALTSNPVFVGPLAMEEYGVLRGSGTTPVPVENQGGQGTRDSHWRESIFINELMTGFINTVGNPLSRLTVASLQDMGYVIDMNAAETYSLANLFEMAERGLLVAHTELIEAGKMLSSIPVTLPDDSLVVQ
jgi:hypothetical protein